jgi:glycosyltransferase involved in cell wall biosynthesis
MNRSGGTKPRYVMFLPWSPVHGGGVNNVVKGLADAGREYYDPVIVVTTSRRPDDYAGEWLFLPYLNPRRPFGFLARLLPVMLRLRRILKGAVAANPHFGGLECIPLVLLRRMRLGPPVIMSIHGADVTEIQATKGWERRLCQWMFGAAYLVVGCSGDLVKRLREFCPQAKTAAVWNAASSPPEVPGERPIDQAYILCVAAFVPKKAHEVLLAAFARIRRDRPDLVLVMIGSDGPTRAGIEEQAHASSFDSRVRILLNQPHSEVWRWMHHAECFVLPSREEPFGIVLLEAGKSRVPVVATRVGGIPEFLTDGEDGLLCDPDNPDQLANAVMATLADQAATERRVDAFYRKACSFTWSAAFDAYRSAAHLP